MSSLTADFSFPVVTGNDTLGNLQVTLTSNSGGNPGTVLATLDGSNPGNNGGTATYTCDSGCSLSPSTTYLIKLRSPGSTGSARYQWKATTSDNEATVPSSNGWSIANAGVTKNFGGAWQTIGTSDTMLMTVTALPKPSLSASSVAQTSATLTITGQTGNWWLQRTTPSGGTCAARESDYSHALSSLTADTDYTYKAYSDSNCTAELHSVTFTTS